MSEKPILVFDSGIGGLSVLRELRARMPDRRYVYIADDAGFPYGDWEEAALLDRIVGMFGGLLATHDPALVVIACGTASTLVLPELRARFEVPFVGTVPAIKPAAEQTRSGLISVLATPGTVRRDYTRGLIDSFARDCEVQLVGSPRLATMAEAHMRGDRAQPDLLLSEISPCFVERGMQKTDIVVLACTHYPFLVGAFRKVAPWPVDWLDPAEAIARQAERLMADTPSTLPEGFDRAIFTAGQPVYAVRRLVHGFGLTAVG